MEVIKSKSVEKAIILMKLLEDGQLIVVDKNTTVRLFDKNTLELKNGFKVNIEHLRYKNSVVSFSNNGEYFATLTSDCKTSRLYNTNTKKMISKIDRHHGEVSCVGIDPLSRHMFSCGDDGKIFAIDVKSGKLVFTLPTHSDTVNDIAFTRNGNWVATAGYDKKISLFNLVTMTPKDRFKAHASPILKLRFLNKHRLLSVDKNSTAIIWNIYTSKIIARLQGIHDDVTALTSSGDDKFLFIGTALGYVLLYDLNTYELLSSKYIKTVSPITVLEFDNERNHLIIGTEDGFVMYYDIYEGEEKLKELLQNREFEAIQKESELNPILTYTRIHELVANFWENTLAKAKIALQNGEQEKALLIFGHFKNIPSKNRIIQKVIKDYVEYDKFVNFAKQGKIALAYNLANTYPAYKDSKLYKSLELRWKKTFYQAQKYALEPKGTDKAKELLAPYRGISEKSMLIQDLMTKGEIYKRFRESIGKRNFVICSELIKQYVFLKEFPEYDTLMAYADGLYIKSQKLVHDGDTNSAVKILRVLSDFSDFKEEVSQTMKEIVSKQKFFDAVKDGNIADAYNILSLNEDLEETKDAKLLIKQWNDDLSIARSYAVFGNATEIKKALSRYMTISSKLASIGTILSWCYVIQLEKAIKEEVKQSVIEKAIKNYMLNFGFQEQIENLFELFKIKYPESKLSLEYLTQGSLSMWRPSMFVSSILD